MQRLPLFLVSGLVLLVSTLLLITLSWEWLFAYSRFSACFPVLASLSSISSANITTTTFHSIPALEDLHPQADDAWSTLSTAGGGFLRVQYNDTYVQSWGISMFHGLHCLSMIRTTLQRSLGYASEPALHNGGREGSDGGQLHQHDPEHITHCFSYIAQALQCAGDSTIEPPWETHDFAGNVRANGVDGLDVTHRCKPTAHLWAAAARSETVPVPRWNWTEGDEVDNVFGLGTNETT